MIFTANIIINLCLIFAVWRLSSRRRTTTYCELSYHHPIHKEYASAIRKIERRWGGIVNKASQRAAIAAKFAERAFNLASTANLTCMYLQKSLQVRPAWTSKPQLLKNEIIQKEVKEAIGGPSAMGDMSDFEWLYSVLGDEEREIVDKAQELAAKYKEGQNKTDS